MTSKKRGLGRGLEALLVDVPAKDKREDVADNVTGMQEVERLKAQLSTAARMKKVEQRREQLPATAGKQEVEQRREQLPGATQTSITADKEQVPVAIDEVDGQAVMATALIKNIQRESTHLLEEAESLISLLDEFELIIRRFEID